MTSRFSRQVGRLMHISYQQTNTYQQFFTDATAHSSKHTCHLHCILHIYGILHARTRAYAHERACEHRQHTSASARRTFFSIRYSRNGRWTLNSKSAFVAIGLPFHAAHGESVCVCVCLDLYMCECVKMLSKSECSIFFFVSLFVIL